MPRRSCVSVEARNFVYIGFVVIRVSTRQIRIILYQRSAIVAGEGLSSVPSRSIVVALGEKNAITSTSSSSR